MMPNTSATEFAFGPHKRLCYYPSCGSETLWILMRLDCDLFVMSDKWPEYVTWARIEAVFKKRGVPVELLHQDEQHLCFTSLGKTVWLFFEDNNVTLARLKRARLSIHHFVGICDGCCEGGNHECVHERPFMSRVLQVAAEGMAYTTDHSRPLERRNRYANYGCNPKFEIQVPWRSFPEPPNWGRAGGPDQFERISERTCFDLQGLLVAPRYVPNAQTRISAGDLGALPKGSLPTQLECLKPFRTLYGRGILAEYSVSGHTLGASKWTDTAERDERDERDERYLRMFSEKSESYLGMRASFGTTQNTAPLK